MKFSLHFVAATGNVFLVSRTWRPLISKYLRVKFDPHGNHYFSPYMTAHNEVH